MLSVENNELLTKVGPGTPMGTLMRYYWQPVCAVDELLRSRFRGLELVSVVLRTKTSLSLPPKRSTKSPRIACKSGL